MSVPGGVNVRFQSTENTHNFFVLARFLPPFLSLIRERPGTILLRWAGRRTTARKSNGIKTQTKILCQIAANAEPDDAKNSLTRWANTWLTYQAISVTTYRPNNTRQSIFCASHKFWRIEFLLMQLPPLARFLAGKNNSHETQFILLSVRDSNSTSRRGE